MTEPVTTTTSKKTHAECSSGQRRTPVLAGGIRHRRGTDKPSQ
jgi:hypothetical protein